MEDETYIGPERFSRDIASLLARVNRIKVMLWAGDSTAARQELESLKGEHGRLITSALKIKSQVVIANRDVKPAAVLQTRNKGREREYMIKLAQAEQSALHNKYEAELFMISPIASLITKLDNRVSRETGQPEVFAYITSGLPQEAEETTHKYDELSALDNEPVKEANGTSVHRTSGFRLSISQRDEGRWEVRGYHLQPAPINRVRLIENLTALSGASVDRTDNSDSDGWPLQIRGYSTTCHFDLTLFDSGRFIFNLVVHRKDSVEDWGERIMDAISKSQEHPPSPDTATTEPFLE